MSGRTAHEVGLRKRDGHVPTISRRILRRSSWRFRPRHRSPGWSQLRTPGTAPSAHMSHTAFALAICSITGARGSNGEEEIRIGVLACGPGRASLRRPWSRGESS